METPIRTVDTLEELQAFIRDAPKGAQIGVNVRKERVVHIIMPGKTKTEVLYTGPADQKNAAMFLFRVIADTIAEKRKAEEAEEEEELTYTVENVDISDDKEPVLYIQRYIYPERTYRVIRKAWDEDEEGEFIPNPDYQKSYWQMDVLLTAEYDPEDEFTEIFASVDRDEEHPPLNNPEEVKNQNNTPCFHVVYDTEDQLFKCEVTGVYGDDVENADVDELDERTFEYVAKPTLGAAIDLGVALLDNLIENSKRKAARSIKST